MSQYLDELSTLTGENWPAIDDARERADAMREQLRRVLNDRGLVPADTSVVVFGSVARGEVTNGSDLDWTLLEDGQADENRWIVTHRIANTFKELGHKPPGRTGIFGGLAFSSEIIHRIGGDADTNKNTTQRILLLLESAPLGGVEVRARVIRQLLRRYVSDDHGYHASHGWRVRVPRLLLNDIVRYWRTMAVDFASKRRERNDEGWALRNFKLRMSRKLLFTAGLVDCLSTELYPPQSLQDGTFSNAETFYAELAHVLEEYLDRAPLDTVVEALLRYGGKAKEPGRKIVGAYNDFLAILNDKLQRQVLDQMTPGEALEHPLFTRAKEVANRFQDGLTEFFFATDERLTRVTQRYGVF